MPQIEAEMAEARHTQDKVRDAAFNTEVALPWSPSADGDSGFSLFGADGGVF